MERQKRHQHVLKHLHRITSDGARCDTRFELDGANVSMTVRSLIGKRLVAMDERGCLVTAPERCVSQERQLNTAVLDQIRQALTG